MKFRHAIAADIRESIGLRWIAVIAAAAWFVFEWGPWNEGVQPVIISYPLKHYENISGAMLTVLAAFGVVFGLQIIGGTLTAYALSSMKNTTPLIHQKLESRFAKLEKVEYMNLSLKTRVIMSFFIGTSAVVCFQQAVTGETGNRAHRPHVFRSAIYNATTITVLATAMSILFLVGKKFQQTEPYADKILGFVSSPITWIVLMGGSTLYGIITAKLRYSQTQSASVVTS